MELTKSQSSVVSKLVDLTWNQLITHKKESLYFKAPTGSGKTFMMLNYIDQLIELSKLENQLDLVFVIVTLSSAELPKQMEESFLEYKYYINNKDLHIQRIESPSNTKKNTKVEKNYQFFAEKNNVYIMGGASFKKNSILREEQAIESFLNEIKQKDYKLIYIRDEAHIGGNIIKNKDEVKFEQQMQDNANFVLKMTATPSYDGMIVELSEKELESDKVKLLKSNKQYNLNLEPNKDYDNESILKLACQEFKLIKQHYNDHINEKGLIGINPAMLIQVDNDSQNELKNQEFNQQINQIINILEENGLTWVKYFDSKDKNTNIRTKDNWTLRDISKNTSPEDVIIFKIGPSIGWNIPRACMLVQLRNISSKNLSIQTIGRIKRNPNPGFDFSINSIANNYYIYSNLNVIDNNTTTAIIKQKYVQEEFPFGYLQSNSHSVQEGIIDIQTYEQKIIEFLNKKFKNSNNEFINESFFKSSYDEYKHKYLNNNFISSESQSYGSANFITSKIINIIDLQIYLNKLKSKYKKYFTNNINEYLNNLYIQMNNHISKQWFDYLVYKDLSNEFKTIYQQTIINQINNQTTQYKIDFNKNLPINIFIEDKDDKNIVKTDEYFVYQDLSKSDISNFYLDSLAEKMFVDKLKIYNEILKIKLWSKNPLPDGISFQYLDDNYEPHNSYPDFIIKHNNHYIYLEVKTYKNDIDENKTKTLYEQYKKYIESLNDKDYKLTMLICLVDNSTTNLYFAGSSSIPELNEKLSNVLDNQNHIHDKIKSNLVNSLNDIFKY
ncbi:DEAD/DEAH box helicase family protein [Mycoplasmopsis felis]|uniref:DEAD/DEAH box helicase family protein n=1 Tax=Mycoplasmopsis felis TaxID=33923 RepID=UPI002B003146|nr:DEAD/DEAH box helicase family protein [Mycoplasmopsis felis]WQQ03644.1 DEAD/DEAH box helicase family protein [Mycoplasmopsis felis]